MAVKVKAYIAGTGMITAIGGNTAMTAAAVKAGMSGYGLSDCINMQGYPITMAAVPDSVFLSMAVEVDIGDDYCKQYDRIIKMAIQSLREAIAEQPIKKEIPLVLALPDNSTTLLKENNYIPIDLLIRNLVKQNDLPLNLDKIYFVETGRAAGIQCLEFALHLLNEKNEDYVLIGGSDSYKDTTRLYDLDEDERLLAANRMDGFAPGEGAGFLLLTRQPDRALRHNKHVIGLSSPGSSQESGHLYSDKAYLGNGLDTAFKLALIDCTEDSIDTIYSSMNGENHWAKEYGVATIRNKHLLNKSVKTEHPADCFGDLGVATGSVLIGLAVENLLSSANQTTQLVYSSSDGAWRSAVRVEKLSFTL